MQQLLEAFDVFLLEKNINNVNVLSPCFEQQQKMLPRRAMGSLVLKMLRLVSVVMNWIKIKLFLFNQKVTFYETEIQLFLISST